MVGQVTSVGTAPGTSLGVARPAGLDADLAKAESQLADWVHCPSSKTPEGKAKIAQCQSNVDQIKAKLKAADDASSASRPQASKPAGAGLGAGSASSGATRASPWGPGGLIDTYA
jgi:hypothetical protein